MKARTPKDVDRLFGEYMNSGDSESLVGLYEPSATLVNRDGTLAEGLPAIREAFAALLENARPIIRMNVVKTVEGGDGIAILYNDWMATGRDEKGYTIEMSAKALEVVRRQPDGTWRFVIDDPYARG